VTVFAGDRRGQTVQDFAFGVSIFLVVTVFAFGLFPNLIAPVTAGVDGSDRAQADRLARSLIQNHSAGDAQNSLNATRLAGTLDESEAKLQERYGLAETASINVTVREVDDDSIVVDDGDPLATGRPRGNDPAATSSRIVTFVDATECRPACRLVVRVW